MKAPLITSLAVVLATSNVAAEDAQTLYHSRLYLSGFLLRSAIVCARKTAKGSIDAALRLASEGETRAFSKAFPQTAERWMHEGAGNFNTGVMKDGITSACAYAEKVRAKASALP